MMKRVAKLLMAAGLCLAGTFVAGAAPIGDVNGDNTVDVTDLNITINVLLGVNNTADADANGDGVVDVEDVNTIINVMLGVIDPNAPQVTTFTVNEVSFQMVTVEGGTFTMGGSADDSNASDDEYPAHQVTLSTFSIGQTEVTQALWTAVMGSNPSYYNTDPQMPVGMVSWEDAQLFVAALSSLTGENFRLPTEAEWEFAARGGNQSQGYVYAGSNDIEEVGWWYANIYDTFGEHTLVPVAQLKANELGLYDMSGNVWELCQDWYGAYSSEPQTNPTGPDTGTYRTSRGGGRDNSPALLRVSQRDWIESDAHYPALGLRIAL